MAKTNEKGVLRDRAQAVVFKYAPLVKGVAHKIRSTLPEVALFNIDDLVQSGFIGLLEASKRHDPDRGASFRTYAGIRIRGEILDWLRAANPGTRDLNNAMRPVSEAARRVGQTMLRKPFHAEVAALLEMDIGEYHRLLGRHSLRRDAVRLDEALELRKAFFSEALSDNGAGNLCFGLDKAEQQHDLRRAMLRLSDTERALVEAHYYRDMSFREVGKMLGKKHEADVSRLHKRARAHLKELFAT